MKNYRIFIFIGLIILRCNNILINNNIQNYDEHFNSSLDIYYPSEQKCVTNNNE